MPASEIETGFIDLILSRPLARHWIITRTIIVTTLAIILVLSLMTTGTWAGLATLAPKIAGKPSPKVILSLVTNLGFLMRCWSGVTRAIGIESPGLRTPA